MVYFSPCNYNSDAVVVLINRFEQILQQFLEGKCLLLGRVVKVTRSILLNHVMPVLLELRQLLLLNLQNPHNEVLIMNKLRSIHNGLQVLLELVHHLAH